MGESNAALHNNQLRQERIRCNWCQREVANQLGTTVVTVNRWERGIQRPSPYFRLKLCALFNKSAEELGFFLDGYQPPSLVETDVPSPVEMLLPTSKVFSLWNVPYPRNPHFTGREELLDYLQQQLTLREHADSTAFHDVALTLPQAIKGLGGIGKTQVAVEYAYRAYRQGHYVHILWVNAVSKESLIASFVELAEMLSMFSTKNEMDPRKLVEAVKQWLEQCDQHWLLIFDNVTDFPCIQYYLPQRGNGSVLLTTRANAVGSFASSITLEKMGLLEGTTFLLHRAQRQDASDKEINEASNVVIALDFFPLALDQAGAYIEETGCNFADYLQLYQTHSKILLARRGLQTASYPTSLATIWSLSFQQIEQTNPAAAELLRLCAFLAPDRIPEEFLKNGRVHWTPLLQHAVEDLFTFHEMIAELLKFSFVNRIAEAHMLNIHHLVQTVQMNIMEPAVQRDWAERVVRAMNEAFPRNVRDVSTWPQCLRYIDQAQACDTLIRHHMFTFIEAADVLNRISIYLCEHGSHALAEPLLVRALSIRE